MTLGRMSFIRFICLLVCIIALAVVESALSRETVSEKNLQEIRQWSVQGCVDKQTKDPFYPYLSPGFVARVCDCFADEVNKRLLNSMDFQIAIAKHDSVRAGEAIRELVSQKVVNQLTYACIESLGGIEKGMDRTDRPKPHLSERKGLGDETRRSMRAGCAESVRRRFSGVTLNETNLIAYCDCFTGYVANEVSEADFLASLRGDSEATAKVEKLSQAATQVCMNMVP